MNDENENDRGGTDIMAIQPADIAGDFKRAAHISALAAEAVKHLPRWTGSHCRVPGNYPLAEVTPHGTLLITNEVTVPDLPAFGNWLVAAAGLGLTAMLPCGHAASSLAEEDPPSEPNAEGFIAEASRNPTRYCAACRLEAQAKEAISDAADLRELRDIITNLCADIEHERNENNRISLDLKKAHELRDAPRTARERMPTEGKKAKKAGKKKK